MVNHELGEILANIPKPRGEGAWAWCRYYLILARRSVFGNEYICAELGCPHPPKMHITGIPDGAYCKLHATPEAKALRLERYLNS